MILFFIYKILIIIVRNNNMFLNTFKYYYIDFVGFKCPFQFVN